MSSALASYDSGIPFPVEGAWQPVCVARLHYHVSWSTRGEVEALNRHHAVELRAILESIARERGVHLQIVAVTRKRVHVALSLRPSQLVTSVTRELKGRSAIELLERCPDVRVLLGGHLVWGDSYGLATVSQKQIGKLVDRLARLGYRLEPESAVTA